MYLDKVDRNIQNRRITITFQNFEIACGYMLPFELNDNFDLKI